MIQTQQFEAFPVFGDSSTKSQPEAAIYSNGFTPGDVLPAEYYNWLTNKASAGITDLNRGVSSIEKELNNVVSAGGQELNESTNNQVLTAIQYLIANAKQEAILAAHPVGSLYWSSSPTNPGQLFGGTWKQIKDTFILAAGDSYEVNATGGNYKISLTASQIPSHTHSFTPAGTVAVNSHAHGLNSHTHSFTPVGTVAVNSHAHGLNSHTHSFTPAGTVSVASHTHGLNSHTHSFSGTNSHSHGMIHYHERGAMEIVGMVKGIASGGGFDKSGAFSDSYNNETSINTWGASNGNRSRLEFKASTAWTGRTSRGYATQTATDPTLKDKTDSESITVSGTTGAATGNTAGATATGTFTGTAGTTGKSTGNTAGATATGTFTGTAGTTGKSTGNTAGATATGTFTGTAGTTGATGSGAEIDITPTYLVKYCWERTA